MNKEDLIEIEESLKESDIRASVLLNKKNDIQKAIEVLEAEDITLPEKVYGVLAYYLSEFDNECKRYRQLLGLRNKLKHNNYEI